MFDLQLLKTFLTVLETGNYSNAALKLGYAQSTITKHIQLLEREYQGAKLLCRQGNRMVPTEQGQTLQRYAVQMLQLHESARSQMMALQKRTIRIGATHALSEIYLPVAIQEIKAVYPDINIHLTGGNPPFLHSLLMNGRIDAMFTIDTYHRDGTFSMKEIRQEPLVVVVPKTHALAGKKSVVFDDIKQEQFILSENGCNFRKLLFAEFAKHNSTPQITMELDSLQSIKHAILQQYGIGFMPAVFLNPDDALIPLFYENSQSALHSMIVYTKSDLFTKQLIGHIADLISRRFPRQD